MSEMKINLPIGDSTHKGGLSGTVLTAKTVAVTTLKTKSSSVKQDLGTVSQRELAVAKIFALLLIFRNLTIINVLGGGLDNPIHEKQ